MIPNAEIFLISKCKFVLLVVWGKTGILLGLRGRVVRIWCQAYPDTGKFHSSYIGMNLWGSTYENGCVPAWR